eukprot:2368809-Pyramimonas_sp.AAC.1
MVVTKESCHASGTDPSRQHFSHNASAHLCAAEPALHVAFQKSPGTPSAPQALPQRMRLAAAATSSLLMGASLTFSSSPRGSLDISVVARVAHCTLFRYSAIVSARRS